MTANVAPRLCSEFQEATLRGDFAAALKLQDKLMPLHVSNVALWCGGHKGPARVGFEIKDGVKSRVCRKCGEAL